MIKTTNPPIRALGILLMFLLSLGIKAQTANNPVLTWDQEVGCIEYDDKGERGDQASYVDLLENIEEGKCIRFCEESVVHYTFTANNIQHVSWQATGGTVQPGSTNNNAAVQWGSSGNGNLTLTVAYTDNTVDVLSVCVEKIAKPKAYFEIDGVAADQREFCVDTAISFNNLSTENNGTAIVSYLWDFGDGTYSNAFEPTHTYTNPGVYTVRLTVTNSCNCSDVYKMNIRITDEKVVDIVCASVVCENSRQTYSVNDGCGGEWKVIGGDIVANNGTSIEVVWNQVDPADGFGYVSYLSRCSCPYWNTVKIPVILGHAKIKGPDVICEGKQGRFTLPQWPTTEFEWMIDGDPNHQMLVLTDQRNEIVVDGMAPGTYTLSVRYRNTLIDGGKCGGETKIQFKVVENVEIVTDEPLTVCTGEAKNFWSHNGMPVSWEISLGGTVVHTAFGPATSYTFNTGGVYVVTANNNGCISDPVVVEVIAKPVLTGTISGPDKVCLTVPYTYAISENEPGAIYVWSVSSGTGAVVGSNAGLQAGFTFASPTATIQVVKQIVKNGVICESAPVYFDVSQIVVTPTVINNSGLSMFCPSSIYTFTANTGGVDVDLIEWELQPSNFGNIISGANDGVVTIGLNEASTTLSGTLLLKVTKCNTEFTYPFTINLLDNLTIDIGTIGTICPTEPFNVPLTFTPAGISGGTLEFYYNDTNMYSTAFAGNGSYTVPQNFVPSSSGSVAGNLTVKWVNPNGCTTTIVAHQQVTVLPLNTVELFNNGSNVICPANTYTRMLEATFSTGIAASSNFIWYYNGSPISVAGIPNTPELTLTDTNGYFQGTGEYYVMVKDVNDCWVTSNKIYLYQDCDTVDPGGPGSGCSLGFNPTPTLTYSWSDCNTVSITAGYNTPLTNIAYFGWEPVTPGAVLGANTITTADFDISKVGVYKLRLKVRYNGCPDTFTQIVEVRKHYEPILLYSVTCDGNNLYTIKLINNSKMFNINPSLVTLQYLYGGSVIGTNVQQVTLPGMAPGTYTYKLRLSTGQTTANGTPIPDCETEVTIVIDGPPALNFTIPNGNTYCANDPITLRLPGSTMLPGYSYRWIFNGTSYVASSVDTEISFAEDDWGSQDISLEVTNQYGCVFESSPPQQVTINIANFSGSIAPNPADFCEGSATPLSFLENPSTPVPSDIIWMRDNVQVGTGLSYLPTQSGSYWPVLIGSNGCKDYSMAQFALSYKLRKPPFASISGSTSVCYGESTTLTGIFTDTGIEHRWALNGTPIAGTMGSWVAGNTNLTLDLNGLTPGSYDYSFETRYVTDTGCTNSFTVTVVAHPQVAAPVISYNIHDCQPYTLRLTASGPAAGTYNWSNGMIGQTIYVTQGGAYSVTYTAPTGCTATGYIQAPHNPERALWVVPSGCYTMCLNNGEYLLGPLGIYEGYEWTINGATSQSGSNTYIPNQPVTMAGYYQLNVTQMGCTFSSNTPHITPDPGCDSQPCKFSGGIRYINPMDGGIYELSVYIVNPYGYPITVNLSSLNGYGTYSPATVTLNPGANTINPLYFYPNGSFTPGVPDGLVIQTPDCMDVWDFRFPTQYYPKGVAEIAEPQLVLLPNPAYETTTVSYDLGTGYQNAQGITLYDVTGVQRVKRTVSGKQGEVTLNVSHLAPGTYMVNLEADGKRIAQQKLIKK